MHVFAAGAAARWRVVGSGVIDGKGAIKGWGVHEVAFYSDRLCTKQIEIKPGTIVASGTVLYPNTRYVKENAFDGKLDTNWAGRRGIGGFWIGAEFENGTQVVQCATVHQQKQCCKYFAHNVALERYNEETEAWIAVACRPNFPRGKTASITPFDWLPRCTSMFRAGTVVNDMCIPARRS